MSEIAIKDVARLLYNKEIETFSEGKMTEREANDVVTNAILELCGGKENFSINKFMKNRYDVFEILQDTIKEPMQKELVGAYKDWIDVVNVGYNETYSFTKLNNNLFEVGMVADGTHDFHRQRLINGKLTLQSFTLAVKIYEEFHNLRTGKIDFTEMIDRVVASFDRELMMIAVTMIEKSYDSLDAKFKYKGTFDSNKLLELCERVEAKTGVPVTIYGTKSALSKLEYDFAMSEEEKNERRKLGYTKIWNGIKVVALPQAIDKDNEFILDKTEKHIYVIPDGTKIVKLILEDDAQVREVQDEKERDDQQFEFAFAQKVQLGVAKASTYGAMVLT